ncbi:c-type cytochrome [Maritalea sp.]|uniref:c-type cytochrome n=1 Tax=Maritalea sp. TaxID=2003361 RepID=UPI003EF84B27
MKFLSILTAMFLALSAPAFADGDVEKGEKIFKKCKACHMVGDKAKSKVGPALNNVFGRQAGSVEDFKYSKAMTEAGEAELVWNIDNMKEFVTKPKKFLKGTKMTFAGLKKEKDQDNLIAYLLQFSPEFDPAATATESK